MINVQIPKCLICDSTLQFRSINNYYKCPKANCSLSYHPSDNSYNLKYKDYLLSIDCNNELATIIYDFVGGCYQSKVIIPVTADLITDIDSIINKIEKLGAFR